MAINDFSTLICMAATMSIAFVATEYVTSYTKNLCERFFKFQEFVKTSFKECRDILTDKESLKQLHPVVIDGQSTNGKIEEAKRQNESINKEIDELENKKILEVTEMCQARSMSSLCLFVFMFNTTLLLLGSIEPKFGKPILTYLSVLSILSILYIISGWCSGEKDFENHWLKFSSLQHAAYSFIVLLIAALVIILVTIPLNFSLTDYAIYVWWWILVVSIIFSYLNFIVFILKVKWKADVFKTDVEKSKNDMKQRCKDVEKEAQDLITISKVSADLNANPFATLN